VCDVVCDAGLLSHCGAWMASGTQHLVPGIVIPASSFGSFGFGRLTLAELT